jgi:hypothetical protein
MTLMPEATLLSAFSVKRSAMAYEEYVCWSRMQTEAGQSLEAIIARKELERLTGGGVFVWGVGNAPTAMTNFLARAKIPVKAIFSIMKSRPRLVDCAPTRTVVWRRYIDLQGVRRELPHHVLVTGRGDTPNGIKRSHYALMCRSDTPLTIRRGEPFDPSAFRNVGGKGAPVGASQVTALLRRVRQSASSTDYEANMVADLTASYWVRLVDPVVVDTGKQSLLDAAAKEDIFEWCRVVAMIRTGPSSEDVGTPEGRLL